MDGFIEYLLQIGYSSSSVQQHVRFFELFNGWMTEKSVKTEECRYLELIHFIDDALKYFSSRKSPKSTVNRMMVSIAAYYDYLISSNPELNNPAKSIRVKNPSHRMAHNLLNKDELNILYSSVGSKSVRDIRNKDILGFLTFQGLRTGELHRLRIDDILLKKGTIFIQEGPASQWKRGSTARELELEALQIIDLIDYMDNFRPRILLDKYIHLPGRKPGNKNLNRVSDQLLLSVAGSQGLKNSLHHLFRNLSEINPRINNATQIRQSVIALWLKRYDLRTVQYMAGHRYVSSTEYYKQINIVKLKRKIDEYHPLNRIATEKN